MNATGDHNGNGNINNPNFGTSDDKAHRLAYLIAGFLKQTLTTAEHDELDEWVNTSKENMQLFERLSDESNLGELEKRIADKDVETARYKIKQKIGFTKLNRTDYKPILRTIAIAASILIAVGLLFLYNYRDEELETSETSMIAEDVAPGNYLATLQLSDGKKIILDSTQKDESPAKDLWQSIFLKMD